MRVSKTVNGVKSDYYYVDGKLYYEKRGSKELYFNYGSDGNLLRIKLSENGTDLYYYVVCNVRGDVVALYTGAGAVKAEYKYDAWGKVLSVTDANGNEITDANNIGLLNPIRYRGYYYDAETGFYYLQSRYYDPEIGRFISVDGYATTGTSGYDGNMFAYCGNNPINMIDDGGCCYYNAKGQWCHDNWEYIGGYKMKPAPSKISNIAMASRGSKANKKGPRKDPRKGSKDRQKSGSRERNIGHKNGEEHSRVPKGNGMPIRKIEAGIIIAGATVAIIIIAADDLSGVGVVDDAAIPVLGKVIWDAVSCFG